MLRTRIGAWTLLTLVVAVGVGVVVRVAIAQRPTVKKVEGHLAPLSVKVTFPDGKTKIAPLVSMGENDVKFHSHTLEGIGEGDAKVTVWLDTVKEFKDTTDREVLVVLKNGTKRRFAYGFGSSQIFLATEADGEEVIALSKVESVEFLKPARKDKEGHAMFDHWTYSPYTGEELSEAKPSPDAEDK